MTRDFTLLFYKVLVHVSEKPSKLDFSTLAVCDNLLKTVKRGSRTSISMNKHVCVLFIYCELSNDGKVGDV